MHCSVLHSDPYQCRLRLAAHRCSLSLCISIRCDAVCDSGGRTLLCKANTQLHLETRAFRRLVFEMSHKVCKVFQQQWTDALHRLGLQSLEFLNGLTVKHLIANYK